MNQVLFGVCWWIGDVQPCILPGGGGQDPSLAPLLLCQPGPVLVLGENPAVHKHSPCVVATAIPHGTGITLPPSPPASPLGGILGGAGSSGDISSPALTLLLLLFPQSTQTQKQLLST